MNETVPVRWASDSDEALMERLRAGDERALSLLAERHVPRLSAFFYRLTGEADAVDDLLQELFLRVYRAREAWKPDGGYVAWLHVIARRLVYDRSRTRRRKPLKRGADRPPSADATTTLFGKVPDDGPTPFTSLTRVESAAKVDEALRALPAAFREAVVLCDLQRLSYEEAARVMGTNVKTLSTRLARGRERLRALLAPYWEAKA